MQPAAACADMAVIALIPDMASTAADSSAATLVRWDMELLVRGGVRHGRVPRRGARPLVRRVRPSALDRYSGGPSRREVNVSATVG
ncbi:hypothetical protein CTKZ_07530 [Cellulomonas algicola]|uniref:Uncharacterized protein n=1 Tax=Cellulomonas algicola TaxID=2071633 RepID=A0A401UX01_9CELL|nr:hypothetical protein CTKZ_07530 [Cellulomonas algicola]